MYWGVAIGALIAASWLFSAAASSEGFVVLYPSGMNFAGPLWKMGLGMVTPGAHWFGLDTAIPLGAFLGPMLLAGMRRDFNLVGFATVRQALARILGGTLMGFGASLAGGCSIGNLSGASILSITNWLAIVAMVSGIIVSNRYEKVWREEIVRFARRTILAS